MTQSILYNQSCLIDSFIEIDLLICLSRRDMDLLTLDRAQDLLSNKIDWSLVFKLSLSHGVTSLVYQNIKQHFLDSIPQNILNQFFHVAYNNAMRNTQLTQELLIILDLLSKHNILAFPFKGPILSASIYGSISLRQFSDLDILVNKSDFLYAIDILVNQLGYKVVRDWKFLDSKWEKSFILSLHEYSLYKNGVYIDLHQTLTPRYFLTTEPSFEYLWKSLVPVNISGHTVSSFAPKDLIWYLCIHGSKESWRNLKWICDIAEFLRANPRIDWSQILVYCRSLGSERMLLIGLYMAQDVLGANLPQTINERANLFSEVREIKTILQNQLFNPGNKLSRKFSFKKTYLHVKMMDTKIDKFNCSRYLLSPLYDFFIALLPNSKDQVFLELPKAFYFVYFLLHPVRIAYNRLIIISLFFDRNK